MLTKNLNSNFSLLYTSHVGKYFQIALSSATWQYECAHFDRSGITDPAKNVRTVCCDNVSFSVLTLRRHLDFFPFSIQYSMSKSYKTRISICFLDSQRRLIVWCWTKVPSQDILLLVYVFGLFVWCRYGGKINGEPTRERAEKRNVCITLVGIMLNNILCVYKK